MDQSEHIYFLEDEWEAIDGIRDDLACLLRGYETHIVNACLMAASELAENLVKKGGASLGGKKASIKDPERSRLVIDIRRKEGLLRIETCNRIADPEDAETVRAHIRKIDRGPKRAYEDRLRELMRERDVSHTRLGLFRIAYEGKFSLACQVSGNILTISATRRIDGEGEEIERKRF